MTDRSTGNAVRRSLLQAALGPRYIGTRTSSSIDSIGLSDALDRVLKQN